MNETKIVNLFGGPGCGKSTMAAGVFSEIKCMGINAELVTEFAKQLVWEQRFDALSNQLYVFGKQLNRIDRLIGKVDVIVTDSPILLSLIYKPIGISAHFDSLVIETFSKNQNLNYFLTRLNPYDPRGRMQTAEEARLVDEVVNCTLERNSIPYSSIPGNRDGVKLVVNDVLDALPKLERKFNE
ncbi:MAG: AAA family ATPase [Desulfitobacteriaceae bacterium]